MKIRDIDNKYKAKLENFLTEIITAIEYNKSTIKGSRKKMVIEGKKQEIKENIKKSLIEL